jgi:hypothetical protein
LSDRYPSTTASDWVTYADFAAVVEVASEANGVPDKEDLERGEGDVGRTVNLRVLQVIWRSPGARPAPAEFEYAALGWHFSDGDSKDLRPMVANDRPRLEVGGTYLMAFTWQPEVCYEGDGSIPAHWNGLGGGSVLPYEQKSVGVGEFAGEQRGQQAALEDARTLPQDALAALATNRGADFVSQVLARTQPGEPEDLGPAPSSC